MSAGSIFFSLLMTETGRARLDRRGPENSLLLVGHGGGNQQPVQPVVLAVYVQTQQVGGDVEDQAGAPGVVSTEKKHPDSLVLPPLLLLLLVLLVLVLGTGVAASGVAASPGVAASAGVGASVVVPGTGAVAASDASASSASCSVGVVGPLGASCSAWEGCPTDIFELGAKAETGSAWIFVLAAHMPCRTRRFSAHEIQGVTSGKVDPKLISSSDTDNLVKLLMSVQWYQPVSVDCL
ncbi:hypothetical protein B0T09DRAFT_375609 [Sordaria sp. MPI-SDFR-AT-0083]|nr:hypothetical protein B0T09DRAFT_375609 [Sordaria sp. MPI-SDFR-AT-0083]